MKHEGATHGSNESFNADTTKRLCPRYFLGL